MKISQKNEATKILNDLQETGSFFSDPIKVIKDDQGICCSFSVNPMLGLDDFPEMTHT